LASWGSADGDFAGVGIDDLFVAAIERLNVPTETAIESGDSIRDTLTARDWRALDVRPLSGGCGQEELEGVGGLRVYGKRCSEALVPTSMRNVLDSPLAGGFELSLWTTLMTTRRSATDVLRF
jgi:hypothetical protein